MITYDDLFDYVVKKVNRTTNEPILTLIELAIKKNLSNFKTIIYYL